MHLVNANRNPFHHRQLLELACLYPAAATWPPEAPVPAQTVSAAAAQLYALLAPALAEPLRREALQLTLASAPVVWVGEFRLQRVSITRGPETAAATAARGATADAGLSSYCLGW